MKKEYILPVCFAAAAHGALLFGFTKSPKAGVTEKKDPIIIPFEIRRIEEEPPTVVETQHTRGPQKAAPEPQPVRGPEPLVVDIGPRQPMTLPPMPSVDPKNISTIPTSFVPNGRGDGKADWGNITDGVDLDNPPRTRFQATPMYPQEARTGGLSGQVVVEFLVDERGNVLDPRVVSSTHRIFEEATLRAVAKWKFEPGRRDGRIVRFRMAAPVVFNLND